MDNETSFKKICSHKADVENIASTIKQFVKLSYFQYDRVDKSDRSRIILTTRPDWLKHCIDNKYYNISYFESNASTKCNKTIFWEMVNSLSAPVFDAAKSFNMGNGFSIIIDNEKYAEYFHFAMPLDAEIPITLYQDNYYFFINFIFYFREKSKKLVKSMENYKYDYKADNIYDDHLLEEFPSFQTEIGDLGFSLKKIYLSTDKDAYLTTAEFECLKKLLLCGNAEKTAKLLNLTARTVYAHIENVKNRLNCRTLFQIGEQLSKAPFIKNILINT